MKKFAQRCLLTAATAASFAAPAWGKIKEGDKFPDFTLPFVQDGKKTVSMAKLKGKVVVVDFWASWCEPCKVSLPQYTQFARKYKAKGVEFVGINVDDKLDDAKSFLKDNPGIKLPMVFDGEKKEVIGKAEVATMPTSYILDKNGVVKVVHKGFRDGDLAALEKKVNELLKGK